MYQVGNSRYYGEYPLGFAICTNQFELFHLLLKAPGADMNAVDRYGNSILHVLVSARSCRPIAFECSANFSYMFFIPVFQFDDALGPPKQH